MNARLAESGQLLSDRDVIVLVEPRYVSLATAGKMYGDLSADYITQLQNTAGFPCVRLGRRRVVPIAQADVWFEAHRLEQAAAA